MLIEPNGFTLEQAKQLYEIRDRNGQMKEYKSETGKYKDNVFEINGVDTMLICCLREKLCISKDHVKMMRKMGIRFCVSLAPLSKELTNEILK